MSRLFNYINPISHLGDRKYSVIIPFVFTLASIIASEYFAFNIAKDPLIVGLYVIYTPLAYIVYFAFRFGIRGGLIVSLLTIIYYFYILYSRNFSGEQIQSGLQATLLFGSVFLVLGFLIGWLKQTVDVLIIQEADEKRRLQAVFHQLPIGAILADSAGTVTQVNKKVFEIFGKKIPLGTKVGKDTFVEYKENDKFVVPNQTPLYLAIHSGKSLVDKEYTIKRPDGKIRYIQVNSSAIYNKNKKTIAAVSIINDVTAQKELEERKDDFVNMASHELKTPLTSMKLYIDGLGIRLKDFKDDKTHKTLMGVKQQVIRLSDLVNNLLDVSRLQTGKLSLNKESFRLDLLISDAAEELAQVGPEIVFKAKTKTLVFADKFRLHQVLTNLISNAIKYTPSGDVITINLKKEDGKAVVSVKDKGIGIPSEQQKKIFDRLYQVTDPNTKTYPGLGMGLYISREIIKRHKGKIWVDSTPGLGSTFYFTVPLVKTGN